MNPPDVPSPIDFHDPEQARTWMEETVRIRPWRPRFFAVFVAALNASFNGPVRVLELGSGPGHLAGAVLKRCRIAEYVALDFSDAMHDLARAHLGGLADRVRFERRDFREPGWAIGLSPVDVVLTLQAVHETRHRDRTPALFRQTREVLKPGGSFLYCDHYLEPGKNPALYLEREEQPDALAAAGFVDIERIHDEGGMALYRASA
jgi:SAM-dependent methyltransferase